VIHILSYISNARFFVELKQIIIKGMCRTNSLMIANLKTNISRHIIVSLFKVLILIKKIIDVTGTLIQFTLYITFLYVTLKKLYSGGKNLILKESILNINLNI